jgi:hypothetical protein
MKAIVAALVTLAVLITDAAGADRDDSANYHLTGCRSFVKFVREGGHRAENVENVFRQGMCAGIVLAVASLSVGLDWTQMVIRWAARARQRALVFNNWLQ